LIGQRGHLVGGYNKKKNNWEDKDNSRSEYLAKGDMLTGGISGPVLLRVVVY